MASTNQIKNTQDQVNSVIDVMKSNVEKVLERDDKINDLTMRSEAMQQGAAQFQQQSRQLKKKYWWQNFKWWLIMITIGVIVLLLIIFLSIKGKKGDEPIQNDSSNTGGT